MHLQVEGRSMILRATEEDVLHALASLRRYGSSSYAVLADAAGSCIQVAGGGQTCAVEIKGIAPGYHRRAHKAKRHLSYPHGTRLAFGAGVLELFSDEWFTVDEAATLFLEFHRGEWPPTSAAGWRDVSGARNRPRYQRLSVDPVRSPGYSCAATSRTGQIFSAHA